MAAASGAVRVVVAVAIVAILLAAGVPSVKHYSWNLRLRTALDTLQNELARQSGDFEQLQASTGHRLQATGEQSDTLSGKARVELLLESVPVADPENIRVVSLEGEVPSPLAPPPRFATRRPTVASAAIWS